MTDARRTVLVVEDDRLSLELVTDLLADAGWTVQGARTGEEGLARALAAPPQLVLLDLGLPGLDGFATLLALRADARTRAIPVIAMTAQAMRGSAAAVAAAGFDGYLTKPIDTRTFSSQVDAMRAARG